MIIMKKCKILWELTKMWYRDTKWANAFGNGAYRFVQGRVATNLQCVKKTKNPQYLLGWIKQRAIRQS